MQRILEQVPDVHGFVQVISAPKIPYHKRVPARAPVREPQKTEALVDVPGVPLQDCVVVGQGTVDGGDDVPRVDHDLSLGSGSRKGGFAVMIFLAVQGRSLSSGTRKAGFCW